VGAKWVWEEPVRIWERPGALLKASALWLVFGALMVVGAVQQPPVSAVPRRPAKGMEAVLAVDGLRWEHLHLQYGCARVARDMGSNPDDLSMQGLALDRTFVKKHAERLRARVALPPRRCGSAD
jgi:hypothetical protein